MANDGNQLNLTVIALVALVAIIALVALVLNVAAPVSTGISPVVAAAGYVEGTDASGNQVWYDPSSEQNVAG